MYAVFLDRDGVINSLAPDPALGTHESPYRPEDAALLPGAAEAIRLLRTAGFRLVVVSNQPAAAKQTASLEQLRAVHDHVAGQLERAGAQLDAYGYCTHHPDGTDPDLSGVCECRKPKPGLLLDAGERYSLDLGASWMVGDSDSDLAAGAAAGCRTVLVEHPASAHRRTDEGDKGLRAPDLLGAAQIIVEQRPR